MNNNILDNNEKDEITNDVKKAFKLARNKRNIYIQKKALIVSLMIIIVFSSIFLYLFINNNPKNIFINNIKDSYNIITKNISKDNIISYDINYDNNKFTLTKDNKNNISSILNSNGEELYSKFGNTYLKRQDDIYLITSDKYYLSASNSDILNVLNYFKNDFIKTIDGNKINGSRVSTQINGKNMNVYLVSLDIDDAFKDNLKNNLINDSKFVSAYKKVNNITKESILSKLQENINNIPSKISFYTSPIYHDILKIELDEMTITKINNNNYSIQSGDSNINVNLSNDIIITTNEHVLEIKETKPQKITNYNINGTNKMNYDINQFFN